MASEKKRKHGDTEKLGNELDFIKLSGNIDERNESEEEDHNDTEASQVERENENNNLITNGDEYEYDSSDEEVIFKLFLLCSWSLQYVGDNI